MDDPINDIEMRNSMENIGACAHHIHKGAIDAGASEFEAYLIICGWFVGQFMTKLDIDEEDDDT